MLRWALTGADAGKVTTIGNAAHSGLSGLYETGKETIEGKVDRINNVYDLEGNGKEWTAEALYNHSRPTRGGGRSEKYTPNNRTYFNPNFNYGGRICSRLTIYIK